MSRIEWDEQKSLYLKLTRGVSLGEIAEQDPVDVIQHPTRSNQQLYVYVLDDYCWIAPCVVEADRIFLKTLYPSRKYTKVYLGKERL